MRAVLILATTSLKMAIKWASENTELQDEEVSTHKGFHEKERFLNLQGLVNKFHVYMTWIM